MAGLSTAQDEILKTFFRLHHLVHRDTIIALDLLRPKVMPANEGRLETKEFFFWLKTFIRSFLGEIDAIGYALRKSVTDSATSLSTPLSNRDLAKISERRYDRDRDEVTLEATRPLPTLESLKLGLRFFPRLFDSKWEPNFSSPGWHALTKLTAARHDFTHSGRLERVMPRDAYLFVEPAVEWYARAMGRLLIECAHETDPDLLQKRDRADPDQVSVPKHTAEPDILDEGFYEEIDDSLGKLIGYATQMTKLIGADTSGAIDLLKELPVYQGRSQKELEQSDGYQFAMRNLVRTLFSEVEGTIGYIELLLSSAVARKVLGVSEDELQTLKNGEVEDKLLAALNLWSLKLGSGSVLTPTGDGWAAFVLARKWRDKVTHPTQIMDFVLLPSVMKTIMKGAWWFLLDSRTGLEIREIQLPPD